MDIVEFIEDMYGIKLGRYQKFMLETRFGKWFTESYDKFENDYKNNNRGASRPTSVEEVFALQDTPCYVPGGHEKKFKFTNGSSIEVTPLKEEGLRSSRYNKEN